MLKVTQLSLLTAVVVISLAGCVSGKPQSDTYTSSSGAVKTIESDREACVRSCNDEYNRCTDMQSSIRSDVSSLTTRSPFGVESDCRDSLKSCLPRCKARI